MKLQVNEMIGISRFDFAWVSFVFYVIVLLFMVAYFSGVVQSPITCAVIMVEMTAARFMTIPLLAVAIIAYECSHRICRTAIYEALADIFLGGIREEENKQRTTTS